MSYVIMHHPNLNNLAKQLPHLDEMINWGYVLRWACQFLFTAQQTLLIAVEADCAELTYGYCDFSAIVDSLA